jgi:methionyl-tRNA formyltransferase
LKSFGVPVVEFNDANSPDSREIIGRYSPDVLLSAAYPQIFTQQLIEATPGGAINFHPSLLPRFRGAHPHYWCLATGEKLGGVTAHYMTTRLDSGDIIAQRAIDLQGLYYGDLYRKIIAITPDLVRDVSMFLSDPGARALPQDGRLATIFRNDREIHRRLDFQGLDSTELLNRIRAGGAHALHRGRRIYIHRAQVLQRNRHMTNHIAVPPGIILDMDERGVFVATKDRAFLVIESVQWARKPSSFDAWVARFRIQIGERLD